VYGELFDCHNRSTSLSRDSRPQRSAHGAIFQVKAFIKAGYRGAVDLDLEKFFDQVNHDVLMSRVARKVTDKVLLRLIGRYLRAGVMVNGIVQATEWGTPQGSPLTPCTMLQTTL
jgi:RNA-directed DNA polymerase